MKKQCKVCKPNAGSHTTIGLGVFLGVYKGLRFFTFLYVYKNKLFIINTLGLFFSFIAFY